MASHVKLRKDKTGVVDYDTQIKEVRWQLVDQLKAMDVQLEQKSQLLHDFADYLRRRSEIESEYSRSLDKLAERFTNRSKRKEASSHSVAQMWSALLSHTRQESKDHNQLSDNCSSFLIQPLNYCLEYTQRLAKKSKEICTQLQDGLLKVTTELQTAWRTYSQYHADYLCADGKLKEAEKQEEKQKQNAKKLERLIEKRQGKVQDIYLKCSKARNDYLLNLDAANVSMKKYYLQDISTLIDCADTGYHLCLGRVMQAYLSSRRQGQQNLDSSLQHLHTTMSGLDPGRDRDALLQDHRVTFCLPFRFPYQPHDGDQQSEISAENEMRSELETRFKQIQTRLTAVAEESQEANKSMLAAQSSLLETMAELDLEPNSSQEESTDGLLVRPTVARRRTNQQDIENLYLTRVKEFLVGSSLESKLQAKHDLLKVAVEKGQTSSKHPPRHHGKSPRVRKNPSSGNLVHNHKLFSGDMLSFLQASGQQIPVVVESCIRYINLNGLHHEGIFRVPGSQVEVNNLRDAFERGEDPLTEHTSDLDSVAGVLKLYFRELKNPLFPVDSLARLLEYTYIQNDGERADQLKSVISSFTEPLIIVMRYLFAFLHHVSQYSDENMMQPYNLAVCFGPSLVRGALEQNQDQQLDQHDAVTLQPQINAMVKNFIVQHESIFPGPSEVRGLVYEKCMTLEQDDGELNVEEGDGEAEYCKIELEAGHPVNRSHSAKVAQQKNSEASKSDKSGQADHRRSASGPAGAGVSVATCGSKVILQIPTGPQNWPRRTHSPGFARREQVTTSPADDVKVDKEVCRQMDSVFKELVSKQVLQESPSSSSSSLAGVPKEKRA
ncbi:rho GTPase-activating protein 4-like [Syngnathus typhle]|uniref:rho GTPase-activating protein 4-like n=1 Tax=Syngnathus typhle TaxID=161592 RepID=UPI002A6B72A3|nr:rho GTPase-activating protein 4-like [Syngnathus typhle]XP_061128969.1 rho GTPase-activating protein 4-like [Syngnathus typhle]XP_061128970.1 rho GTPase-activating protein 4-like [Syngnathus typhle]